MLMQNRRDEGPDGDAYARLARDYPNVVLILDACFAACSAIAHAYRRRRTRRLLDGLAGERLGDIGLARADLRNGRLDEKLRRQRAAAQPRGVRTAVWSWLLNIDRGRAALAALGDDQLCHLSGQGVRARREARRDGKTGHSQEQSGSTTMKWITREHVNVDRVACPWLIKNFVDKDAEFIFVPGDKVMPEAERLGAIPYDVKGVELGHHGRQCSFEAILTKYALTGDPALALLGKIVNGADTDNSLYRQPEAAGLKAIAKGFRHLGYQNDHQLNAAEWIVYDALHAYCREMVRQGKPDGEFR